MLPPGVNAAKSLIPHTPPCAESISHVCLTLPVMVAFVVSMIWRQLGSVREAVRVLHEEGQGYKDGRTNKSVKLLNFTTTRIRKRVYSYRFLSIWLYNLWLR